jgi:hypothetical protein
MKVTPKGFSKEYIYPGIFFSIRPDFLQPFLTRSYCLIIAFDGSHEEHPNIGGMPLDQWVHTVLDSAFVVGAEDPFLQTLTTMEKGSAVKLLEVTEPNLQYVGRLLFDIISQFYPGLESVQIVEV